MFTSVVVFVQKVGLTVGHAFGVDPVHPSTHIDPVHEYIPPDGFAGQARPHPPQLLAFDVVSTQLVGLTVGHAVNVPHVKPQPPLTHVAVPPTGVVVVQFVQLAPQ